MRKKVAVLLPWLKMGGTNKVALRFIKELIEYCDVTLVLSQNTGELFEEVPAGVEILIDEMRGFREYLAEDIRHLRLAYLMKDGIYYGKIKAGKDSIDNYRYLVERHPAVSDTEYDCAISYHGQSPERLLNLIYRVHARKKVAWIHGEMSFSKENCQRMKKYYDQMDHFFFVSNHTKDSFKRSIGLSSDNYDIYYNPLNGADIWKASREVPELVFDQNQFNLVTVGRLSSEKGQEMIPELASRLLQAGINLRWYLIGDGPDEERIRGLIREWKVEDAVILLGVKNNPYCYVRQADLYVQPSYTEGYSTTICEAGILGQAIVGTKPSGGIYDQITHGEDGFIVEASVDGLYEGILSLYENPDLRKQFEMNIKKKNFEGKGEIEKFLRYINE